MTETFRRFSRLASDACGTWQAFILNMGAVLIWLLAGPEVHWSDAWQLVCNTFTTVITYLLLFLVMNTQSRDTAQMNLKMDAIIAALPKADNAMIALEDLTEEQIKSLRRQFDALAEGSENLSMRAERLSEVSTPVGAAPVKWSRCRLGSATIPYHVERG